MRIKCHRFKIRVTMFKTIYWITGILCDHRMWIWVGLVEPRLEDGSFCRMFLVALCYETQYLFKSIIHATSLQSTEQKKLFFFKCWMSLDLGNSCRQIVTDIVWMDTFLWHFGIKAHTKCSFPLCPSRFLFINNSLTCELTSEEITRHQWVVLVRICVHA